jgi:hypothetical protein
MDIRHLMHVFDISNINIRTCISFFFFLHIQQKILFDWSENIWTISIPWCLSAVGKYYLPGVISCALEYSCNFFPM